MDPSVVVASIAALVVLGFLAYSIVLGHCALRRVKELTEGSRAALQNIQYQLAFIAGRIGLKNQDLQAAAVRAAEPAAEEPRPEVIGGVAWNDFEELLDRAEAGEVDIEGAERAG